MSIPIPPGLNGNIVFFPIRQDYYNNLNCIKFANKIFKMIIVKLLKLNMWFFDKNTEVRRITDNSVLSRLGEFPLGFPCCREVLDAARQRQA